MIKLQKSAIEISVLIVIWKERKDGIFIITIIIIIIVIKHFTDNVGLAHDLEWNRHTVHGLIMV